MAEGDEGVGQSSAGLMEGVAVCGSLSMLVMSTVGLAVGVLLVSVVSGLVVMSAAVEVIVVMSESIAVPPGDSWVGCAVRGLGGAGLAVMWGIRCWAVHRQAQSSLMVWHWNRAGAKVWIVQCWCRVCRSCFLSSV